MRPKPSGGLKIRHSSDAGDGALRRILMMWGPEEVPGGQGGTIHPEIMRELTAQRRRDLQERAHQALVARTARRTLRALRRHGHQAEANELVVPAIPDYVDGSFRTAGDEAASRVPAARNAA